MRVLILAGGNAERFGGIPKEMLPCGENKTFLSRLIEHVRENVNDIDDVTVVSNSEKIHLHKKVPGIDNILIRPELNFGLYDAISLGQSLETGTLVLLADTHFNSKFEFNRDTPLSFGLFPTRHPERFSVIDYNGIIRTKSKNLHQWYHSAWGCFYYTPIVAQYIREYGGVITDYDVILQSCIDTFGYQPFTLYDYYDIGTYERYIEWIKSR